MSPNVLNDFRLDVGDESPPSGVPGPVLNSINSVRVDFGDDDPSSLSFEFSSPPLSFSSTTPSGIPKTGPEALFDLRLDIGDQALPSGASISLQSPVDNLRTDIGDDDGTISSLGFGQAQAQGNCTDNAIVRFDGTSCDTIQNSLATINDTGDISTPGSLNIGGDINVTGIINGLFKFREVITPGTITLNASDNILFVNKTVGEPTSVNLPTGVSNGHMIIIKDAKGDSNLNPIRVIPPVGTIDGQAFINISTSYRSLTFIKNNSGWGII